MANISFREYWKGRDSSMNRGSDSEYYRRKAVEHVRVLETVGPPLPVMDFGCGGGELLAEFAPVYQESIVGVDYSASLLERAREALSGTGVVLHHGEAIAHASSTACPRWMTCGAVNQYSHETELREFISAFRLNTQARELFLFDTIDPVRLHLVRGGLIDCYVRGRTRASGKLRKSLKAGWYCLSAAKIALGRPEVVADGAMGYGVKLDFWRRAAASNSLDVWFQSSAEFEYRYHVVLTKRA